ncbi:MAG: HIT family protein [Cenarchaeum symbiont of Oopsacas minuta]|nr:HIT family protein [Cenarchaeum symbiont of Oopsacas minuta]
MFDEHCVFCSIISGDISAKIVADTKSSIAFMDAFPLSIGHVVIIPRRHCKKIQDMDTVECTDLFGLVQRVIKKVDTLTGSTLVAIHNGKESGQEIPHVHVHLVPRSKNDGAGPVHSMFGKISVREKDIKKAYDLIRCDN